MILWPAVELPAPAMLAEVPSGQLADRLRRCSGEVRAALRAGGAGERDVERQAALLALVDPVVDALLARIAPARDSAEVERRLAGVGARYARAQVPLRELLADAELVAVTATRTWWHDVLPGDLELMSELGLHVEPDTRHVRDVLDAAHRRAEAAGGQRAAARRRVTTLLAGGIDPDRETVEAAGVRLAASYLVLSAAPREVNLPVDVDGIPTHRELLPIELGHHLVVLVPTGLRPDASAERRLDAARTVLAPLAPASVRAGATVVARGDLPRGIEVARGVLSVAAACGRSGVVLGDQLLPEQAVAASPGIRAALAGVIERLDRHPHLVETLRALYDHDLNRSESAAALGIARRTLTQRLDRVGREIGLVPTSARGVQTLVSALAAFDMQRRGDTPELAGDVHGARTGGRRGPGVRTCGGAAAGTGEAEGCTIHRVG